MDVKIFFAIFRRSLGGKREGSFSQYGKEPSRQPARSLAAQREGAFSENGKEPSCQ
jgi:hypothetical protein